MPRYVIERTYTVDMEQLPTVAQRSRQLGHDEFPEIVWEHSHVVVDGEGTIKSFCVYDAPTEEIVLEHSKKLGDHFVEAVYEIAGDVTPADFPLADAPSEAIS